VLGFGQTSEDWEEDSVLDGARRQSGAFGQWDSTRGLLSGAAFPLAVGPDSVADERDDVFPRRVRIVLQVARGSRPDALVRTGLGAEDEILRVNSARELPDETFEDRYVKVGREWMQLTGSGDDLRVLRGKRQTKALLALHPAGTPVFAGKTFRKTLALPAKRSYWVGESK
jgi:hypothetical protein